MYVPIADCFDLEDTTTLRDDVEFVVHRLEQRKDLRGFPHGGPRRKANQIGKLHCITHGKAILNCCERTENGTEILCL